MISIDFNTLATGSEAKETEMCCYLGMDLSDFLTFHGLKYSPRFIQPYHFRECVCLFLGSWIFDAHPKRHIPWRTLATHWSVILRHTGPGATRSSQN